MLTQKPQLCSQARNAHIINGDPEQFEKYAKEQSKKQQTTTVPTPPASTTQATGGSLDDLRKYKELLDEGIITQEEFDAKKKQILNL